ncbi:MAG: SPASM domain-containing protein [Bacteroidales bacterium]|nr:SPASM domain-containing protein [Bacteroidales bacterium]MBN2633382.1 SPASM domain-containing protein [Bacteroidales bacterium]
MGNPKLRFLNAFLVAFSYLQASLSHKPVVYGMPPALGVELTNHCNLKCPECSCGSELMTRNKGFMKTGLFEKIVSELGPYLLNLNLCFQGESMLHPQFFNLLAKCRHIHSSLSTNGHFLSPENADLIVKSGLNKLIVSLDGMDQQTYSLYRVNGNLETVLTGIQNVAEARSRFSSPMKLVIQFIVNRHNEHQIGQVRDFANKMKATLHLKSMQIINGNTHEAWIPSISKYARYRKTEEGYSLRSRLPDRCARLWFNPVITWDGNVLPCCFDKDAEHIMGNLLEESFRDIWNGPRYRLFRRSLLTERAMIDICRNCTSGLDINFRGRFF